MKYVVWAGMAIVSLVMLMGGSAKLAGQEMALTSFSQLGLPSWFALFIAVSEIAGAFGLWIRRTSFWAALGIAIIMAGAIYYHLSFPPAAAGVPALVVLLICGYIISRRGTGVIGPA
ncbi:MAG: DoxX family protein [Pseudomonadota bacterium]